VLRFLLCLSLCLLLSPSPGPPQSVYSRLLVSWNDYNRKLRSDFGRLEIRVEEHFLRRLNYAKVVIKVFRSLKVSSPSLSNTKTADIPVFRLGPVSWPSGEPQVTHRLSLGIRGFSRRTDPPLLSSIIFFMRCLTVERIDVSTGQGKEKSMTKLMGS